MASETRSALGAAVTPLAELAAKHAVAAEAARNLTPEVVEAVVEAGFARYFVPERFGGDAGRPGVGFTDLLDAVAEVGAACAATAWFASLTASLGRMAAYLPAEAQAELWADSADPIIVGALMPLGRATAADGGWRLNGRWPYVSGIAFSRWALVCAPATGADGATEARFFAVPRGAYGVVETWFSVGMRATGSNTIVVDDVFVPSTHTFSRAELMAGHAPEATAPSHQVPLRAVNGLTFAAPLLGAARGAVAAYRALAAERPGPLPPPAAATLAHTDGVVDAAGMLLTRAAAVADRAAGPPDAGLVARSTRDCALAATLLPEAVAGLVRAAGTSGMTEDSPLQRLWRDVTVGSSHVVLRFDAAAAAFCAEEAR